MTGREATFKLPPKQKLFATSSALAETSFSMSETVRAFNGVSAETNKYETSQFDALQLEEVQAWSYQICHERLD
jgi:hypothetical protein